MNWKLEGKTAKGKEGIVTIVGGPDTEKGIRELAGVTHPGFTVSKATPDRPDDVQPDEPAPPKETKAEKPDAEVKRPKPQA